MTTTATKRLTREFREMLKHPSPYFLAAPIAGNLFEWHYTIRGPKDSEFEGGKYHGKLLLPSDYPYSPPDFIFLTPNGRYEVNTKICLSITRYHPEEWQPTWGIRKMLEAVAMFMITPAEGAVGAISYAVETRKALALTSGEYTCPVCQRSNESLLPGKDDEEMIRAYEKANALEDDKLKGGNANDSSSGVLSPLRGNLGRKSVKTDENVTTPANTPPNTTTITTSTTPTNMDKLSNNSTIFNELSHNTISTTLSTPNECNSPKSIDNPNIGLKLLERHTNALLPLDPAPFISTSMTPPTPILTTSPFIIPKPIINTFGTPIFSSHENVATSHQITPPASTPFFSYNLTSPKVIFDESNNINHNKHNSTIFIDNNNDTIYIPTPTAPQPTTAPSSLFLSPVHQYCPPSMASVNTTQNNCHILQQTNLVDQLFLQEEEIRFLGPHSHHGHAIKCGEHSKYPTRLLSEKIEDLKTSNTYLNNTNLSGELNELNIVRTALETGGDDSTQSLRGIGIIDYFLMKHLDTALFHPHSQSALHFHMIPQVPCDDSIVLGGYYPVDIDTALHDYNNNNDKSAANMTHIFTYRSEIPIIFPVHTDCDDFPSTSPPLPSQQQIITAHPSAALFTSVEHYYQMILQRDFIRAILRTQSQDKVTQAKKVPNIAHFLNNLSSSIPLQPRLHNGNGSNSNYNTHILELHEPCTIYTLLSPVYYNTINILLLSWLYQCIKQRDTYLRSCHIVNTREKNLEQQSFSSPHKSDKFDPNTLKYEQLYHLDQMGKFDHSFVHQHYYNSSAQYEPPHTPAGRGLKHDKGSAKKNLDSAYNEIDAMLHELMPGRYQTTPLVSTISAKSPKVSDDLVAKKNNKMNEHNELGLNVKKSRHFFRPFHAFYRAYTTERANRITAQRKSTQTALSVELLDKSSKKHANIARFTMLWGLFSLETRSSSSHTQPGGTIEVATASALLSPEKKVAVTTSIDNIAEIANLHQITCKKSPHSAETSNSSGTHLQNNTQKNHDMAISVENSPQSQNSEPKTSMPIKTSLPTIKKLDHLQFPSKYAYDKMSNINMPITSAVGPLHSLSPPTTYTQSTIAENLRLLPHYQFLLTHYSSRVCTRTSAPSSTSTVIEEISSPEDGYDVSSCYLRILMTLFNRHRLSTSLTSTPTLQQHPNNFSRGKIAILGGNTEKNNMLHSALAYHPFLTALFGDYEKMQRNLSQQAPTNVIDSIAQNTNDKGSNNNIPQMTHIKLIIPPYTHPITSVINSSDSTDHFSPSSLLPLPFNKITHTTSRLPNDLNNVYTNVPLYTLVAMDTTPVAVAVEADLFGPLESEINQQKQHYDNKAAKPTPDDDHSPDYYDNNNGGDESSSDDNEDADVHNIQRATDTKKRAKKIKLTPHQEKKQRKDTIFTLLDQITLASYQHSEQTAVEYGIHHNEILSRDYGQRYASENHLSINVSSLHTELPQSIRTVVNKLQAFDELVNSDNRLHSPTSSKKDRKTFQKKKQSIGTSRTSAPNRPRVVLRFFLISHLLVLAVIFALIALLTLKRMLY